MINYSDTNFIMINKKLRLETQQRFFFNRWIGEAKYNPTLQQWAMSGSPIERMSDFKPGMTTGNKIIVEMLRNVKGYGFNGNATVLGNEKELGFLKATVWCHLKRQGIKLPTIVAEINVSWMHLASHYSPQISKWFAGYLNADVTASLLEGYSRHITDATTYNGLGVTKKYHKNFLIWDGGNNVFTTNAPTFSQTSATYKASLISKFGDLAAADVFDVDTVFSLPTVVNANNIQGFMIDGEEVYAVVINSRQDQTLRSDTRFQTIVANAAPRGSKNPFFNAATYRIGKFVFFVDDVVTRFAYYSGTTLDFFNYSAGAQVYNPYTEAVTTQELIHEKPQSPGVAQYACCALLLGESAVAYAPYTPLAFAKEGTDYGNVQGIAAKKYYGFNRLDFYDAELNVGTEIIPTDQFTSNSAIIVTYQA